MPHLSARQLRRQILHVSFAESPFIVQIRLPLPGGEHGCGKRGVDRRTADIPAVQAAGWPCTLSCPRTLPLPITERRLSSSDSSGAASCAAASASSWPSAVVARQQASSATPSTAQGREARIVFVGLSEQWIGMQAWACVVLRCVRKGGCSCIASDGRWCRFLFLGHSAGFTVGREGRGSGGGLPRAERVGGPWEVGNATQ